MTRWRRRPGRFLTSEDAGADAGELLALMLAELAETGCHQLVHHGLHGFQQLKSTRSDAGNRLPLVLLRPVTANQPAGLQAVDETGDVGGALQHTAGDLAAGMPLGIYPAQDAQNVVLRTRDTVRAAERIHTFVEAIGREQQAQGCFLERRRNAFLLETFAQGLVHIVKKL